MPQTDPQVSRSFFIMLTVSTEMGAEATSTWAVVQAVVKSSCYCWLGAAPLSDGS